MDYLLYIGALICIWIIVCVAVNLVVGYTGMMAMGHAAYLGVGAYTAASLNIFYGVDYSLAMAIAALCGAVVAVLTLLPLLRLGGLYFGLATLGLNFVFFDLFHNLGPRVEASEGLHGLILPLALAAPDTRFATTLCITVVCIVAARHLVDSPLGRLLRATRDRPEAVDAVGKNPTQTKIVVWAVSGALTGLAGGLYAATLSYIDASLFTSTTSIAMMVFVGVGGLASTAGSVLGPVLLIAFTEALRFVGLSSQFVGPVQQALYGVLLILLMIFRRQGLVGRYDFRE